MNENIENLIRPLTNQIITVVATRYQITEAEIKASHIRGREVTNARWVAIRLCHDLITQNCAAIARAFGADRSMIRRGLNTNAGVAGASELREMILERWRLECPDSSGPVYSSVLKSLTF